MTDHPIRPFAPADAGAVEELLRRSWGHDPRMQSIYRVHRDWPESGPLRRTLVRPAGQALAGAGTLFESTIHPLRLFATINVAPEWRGRGVGAALFDALARLGGRRPWIAKLTLRDAQGRRFLERRGFRVAVRTLTGLLDPARSATRAWLAGLPPAPPDLRLDRLEQPSPAQLAGLAEAHAAVYRWTHAWNPPANQGPEALLARFCGPLVLPGSQIGAWRGERLAGAANLIADPLDPQPGAAYLVWIGPVDPLAPDAPAITAALLRAAGEYAATQGLALRFEADSSHTHLRALLDSAPAEQVDRDFAVMMQDGEGRP